MPVALHVKRSKRARSKSFPNSPEDWRDFGRELGEALRERKLEQIQKPEREQLQQRLGEQLSPEEVERALHWYDAVIDAVHKENPSFLVKRLSRPLTSFDRSILANLLEDAFTGQLPNPELPIRSRGRPRRNWARYCADVALGFYRVWKKLNQEDRIPDRGHSDEMKDEACRVVTELRGDKPPPGETTATFQEIRDLMERSRSRRLYRQN